MSSIVLMDNTFRKFEVIGEKKRVDHLFHKNNGLYTLVVTADNLEGQVWLEASLAQEPTEEDWFPIWLTSTQPQIFFKNKGTFETTNITMSFSFKANILWLRSRLTRSHILNQVDTTNYGNIQQIIVSA